MKTYIKPEMEINELELTEMIAMSGTDASGKSILEHGGSTREWVIGGNEVDTKQRGEGFDLLW